MKKGYPIYSFNHYKGDCRFQKRSVISCHKFHFKARGWEKNALFFRKLNIPLLTSLDQALDKARQI